MAIQDKFNRPNVIYKITKDIDLGGGTLAIPEGCTLDFQGGSLSNGTIEGNNTAIQAPLTKIFGLDVELIGSWNIAESYPEWFGAKGNGATDCTSSIQKACNTGLNVKLGKGVYIISSPISIKNGGLIGCSPKNTVVILKGSINGLELSREYITQNRSTIRIENLTIQGELSNIESTIGIKFIDTTANQYISGVRITNIELNNLARGIYLSQCFRVNIDVVGMSTVLNPIKIVGSVVQCSFTNITCNLDYGEITTMPKIGLEATDHSNTIESCLFSKCSFVSYEHGVYFVAPALICNFESMDLDFCSKTGFTIGNSSRFNIKDCWICLTGSSPVAGIHLLVSTTAASYPIIISRCTFMSNTTADPIFIKKDSTLYYGNKLIIKDNLLKAYNDKTIGGMLYGENIVDLYLHNNVVEREANAYYCVYLNGCKGRLSIKNNTFNGRLYLMTPNTVDSRYEITDNNATQFEIQNNALNKTGYLEFIVDRNVGSLICNGVAVSSSKIDSSRTAAPYVGFQKFDKELSRPIWWTGSNWVDATGATV